MKILRLLCGLALLGLFALGCRTHYLEQPTPPGGPLEPADAEHHHEPGGDGHHHHPHSH